MIVTANSLSLETPLLDCYDHHYRSAKHSGDKHRRTVGEYRSNIVQLNRYVQFPWWCERFDNPTRGLPLEHIYNEFQIWARYYRCEPAAGDDGFPVVTVGDLSDDLLIGSMDFLIEVGREHTTANKRRGHINAVWTEASRRLKKLGIDLPRPDNDDHAVNLGTPIALLPDEFERVLAAAATRRGMVGTVPAGEWWPAAIMFVFSLGVRITAAIGIPTGNLDLTRGEVTVPAWAQKNRREQLLDLFPSAVTMLRHLRLAERGVPTVLGDWPYTIDTLRDHYKQILVAADIGYDSPEEIPASLLFHCLRRTLGSMLYEKHGIHVTSDRLGHSATSVTQRYIDPRYEGKPRINELLDDPLGIAASSPPPTLRIADVG